MTKYIINSMVIILIFILTFVATVFSDSIKQGLYVDDIGLWHYGKQKTFYADEIYHPFQRISEADSGIKDQLAQRFDQPYRVSIEAGLNGGYYNGENTFVFLPSIPRELGPFFHTL